MGLPQLLPPSKLSAAQASIQAGGDGVRDGVAMMLTAISEYNDMQGSDGVNGSQVGMVYIQQIKLSVGITVRSGPPMCKYPPYSSSNGGKLVSLRV